MKFQFRKSFPFGSMVLQVKKTRTNIHTDAGGTVEREYDGWGDATIEEAMEAYMILSEGVYTHFQFRETLFGTMVLEYLDSAGCQSERWEDADLEQAMQAFVKLKKPKNNEPSRTPPCH